MLVQLRQPLEALREFTEEFHPQAASGGLDRFAQTVINIRIMIEEAAEKAVTIARISTGVEDMEMPNEIDVRSWAHRLIGIRLVKGEKAEICLDRAVDLFMRPFKFFFRVLLDPRNIERR